MAESKEGVALELTRIILLDGNPGKREAATYSQDNVLRVYRAALRATSGKADREPS